jgi:hypothetical protein
MNDPKQQRVKHYFSLTAPSDTNTMAILHALGNAAREIAPGMDLDLKVERYVDPEQFMKTELSRDSDGHPIGTDPAAAAGFEQGAAYRKRQLDSRGLK